MLDVSRDARWGRCAESPGEDPLLGATFARGHGRGLSASGDLSRPDSVMATAKHFAGYGFAEAGRDYNAVDASPYRMHNVVLPPFKAAVEAGAGAIMVGFHDLAGIPCTAHRGVVARLAARTLGLRRPDRHPITRPSWNWCITASPRTTKEAAYLAIRAGVDIDLVGESYLPPSAGAGRGRAHRRGRDRRRLPARAAGQGEARAVLRALSWPGRSAPAIRDADRRPSRAWRGRRRRSPACC